MKISYNWLKEYINTNLPAETVAEMLTDTGLEVEGTEEIETIKGGLRGVVIGEVLTCEPHPDADRLQVTTVDIGEDEAVQIVCGAPNVAAGQKVPVATVGTFLYDGDKEFKIKKSKIRGQVSMGMICAEDELNLGASHEGIMVLDTDAEPGTPASEYFNIESDHVFEIGLTPNRTDAMSHYGVARDLRAALLRHGHENVELNQPSVRKFQQNTNDLFLEIEVQDQEACPRYMGLSLTGIEVKASPDWLQNKLRAIGLAPVNNVVDVTNFVLHETGHPLHAFDVAQIAGNKVIVKKLAEGTKFTTLDDKERELSAEDLMICNGKEEPMCIAGVFGGAQSGVNEKTQNIFLEAAYFDPVSVRKTAKRHALNTDASFRYERGVDPEMTEYALKRATLLIQEIAGGQVAMPIKDLQFKKIEGAEVTLNLERMYTLLGQEIPLRQVREILRSLEIQVKSESGGDLLLQVPAYRADVTREADIVEEILRIYGFNAIDFDHKMHISVAQTDPKAEAKYREKISAALSSRGFNEIMNNSLTRPSYFNNFGFRQEESVEMLNPLSQDLAVLRQSLVFGGLETVAHNANRQRPDLKLYEFGNTYRKTAEGYQEANRVALWISGKEGKENWKHSQQTTDFFSLKNEVTHLLQSLGFQSWEEEDGSGELFDFSLEIRLNKQVVATLGKVKTKAAKLAEVKQEVFYADLNWDYLAKKAKKNKIQFSELPRFPEVRRDLALLVDKSVRYSDLRNSAEKSERKLLQQVNLFDVYEGKNLPEGKKSYALSFTLRDKDKTLNDKQVDKAMERILNQFKKEFKAELR